MPHVLLREEDDWIGTAQIKSDVENDEEYFALTSSNICRSGRCILTVIFTRPEEREWAIGIWKSLQAPKEDAHEGDGQNS